MEFSTHEIQELIKAWLAISLAFTFALVGLNNFSVNSLVLSALTVGIGFLLHELGHKFVAQRYGFPAQFQAFNEMLVLAVVISLTGFVFAAPGAVFIGGYPNEDQNGRISVAGPAMSILLALIFFILIQIFGHSPIFAYGFQINSWLALFNLIPLGNFDGRKILAWNKAIYASLAIFAFTFSFIL